MRLFTVTFADGFTVVQSLDDRAIHYPRDGENPGTAWTDVLGHLEHSTPEWFTLHSEKDGQAEYRLHLPTGTFYASDVPFRLHSEDDLPLAEIQLYFVRRRKQDVTINVTDQSVAARYEHPIVYRFGWTAHRANGLKADFILEVD